MDREEGEEEVKTEGKAMGADKTEAAAKCQEAEEKVKVGKEVIMHQDRGERKKERKKEKVRISVILAEKEDTGLENVPIAKIQD